MTDQKKKLGRTVTDTEPVMVRMMPQMIKALDEQRRMEEDLPSRPELIRRIVAEWLERRNPTKH